MRPGMCSKRSVSPTVSRCALLYLGVSCCACALAVSLLCPYYIPAGKYDGRGSEQEGTSSHIPWLNIY